MKCMNTRYQIADFAEETLKKIQNSPIDIETGQKYWILGVGHVGKADSLRG